jgi:hypothetical protein
MLAHAGKNQDLRGGGQTGAKGRKREGKKGREEEEVYER